MFVSLVERIGREYIKWSQARLNDDLKAADNMRAGRSTSLEGIDADTREARADAIQADATARSQARQSAVMVWLYHARRDWKVGFSKMYVFRCLTVCWHNV